MDQHNPIINTPGAGGQLVAGPMPGHPLALRLYRLLEDRPEADLLHVLSAIRERQAADAGDTPGAREDDRQRFVRESLNAATSALGTVPSRRAYEKWRAEQPNPSEYASEGLIKKVCGGWTAATEALGRPSPDPTARRLLSKGRAFTMEECREALLLYLEATPPDELSKRSYGQWARSYSRTHGAVRVPLNAHTLRKHLGIDRLPDLWTRGATALGNAAQDEGGSTGGDRGDAHEH